MIEKGADFFRLLESIRIDKIDNRPLAEQLSPLSYWLASNIPTQLYRFLSSKSRNIEAFEKDQIWGSRPATFNDPYECMPSYDTDYLDLSLQHALGINKKIQCFDDVEDTQDLSMMHPATRESLCTIAKLLNSSDFKKVLSTDRAVFINRIMPWWKECYEEIAQEFTEYFISNRQEQYITCLSEKRDETLMWAHYADSHKGFCLEYDMREYMTSKDKSNISNCKPIIGPVHYSSHRFDATSLVIDMLESKLKSTLNIDNPTYLSDDMLSFKCLLIKSDVWKYEKEWRLFTFNPTAGIDEDHRIQAIYKPKALFIGARMEQKTANVLQEICDQKNIPCYKMIQTFASKTYTFEPILYREYIENSNSRVYGI